MKVNSKNLLVRPHQTVHLTPLKPEHYRLDENETKSVVWQIVSYADKISPSKEEWDKLAEGLRREQNFWKHRRRRGEVKYLEIGWLMETYTRHLDMQCARSVGQAPKILYGNAMI